MNSKRLRSLAYMRYAARREFSKHYWDPQNRVYQVKKYVARRLERSAVPTPQNCSSPQDFAGALQSRVRLSGHTERTVNLCNGVIESISKRLAEVEHAIATAEVLERITDPNVQASLRALGSERLFELVRASQSVGLFAASGPMYAAALSALECEISSLSGPRKNTVLVRIAIGRGDFSLASDAANRIESDQWLLRCQEISGLLRYVALWSGDFERATRFTPRLRDSEFQKLVAGRNALVYGPGPTDAHLPDNANDWQVSRVLMPGVTRWHTSQDLVEGKTDIVYANPHTHSWLLSIPANEARAILQPFDAVVSKYAEHSRQLKNHTAVRASTATMPPTFLGGAPQMGQIMLWDLISGPVNRVYVTGMSLMLGSTPYRNDSRRYFPERAVTSNAVGGTGRKFERSSSLAGHNPIINRRFISGLLVSNKISGDAHLFSAIAMTDSEYLRALDRNYGELCL